MSSLSEEIQKDVERIQQLPIVPSILELVCRITGMGFSAVARVTEDKWIACAVRDDISFGLKPGGELKLESTICNEIRGHGQPVVIDEVSKDEQFCDHHTPRQYGFQSYISIPIILKDGSFFGTLCAIDPRPFELKSSNMVTLFTLFADLISFHMMVQDTVAGMNNVLSEQQSRINIADDTIRQFSHISSHSLREPLRKLRLFSDKLIRLPELPPDHEAKQIALKINGLAGNFIEMIQQLTDFSQLDKPQGDWYPVDLNDIANGVQVSFQSVIAKKEASIIIDELPSIEASTGQMTILFSHLISNALRFSRPNVPPVISIEADNLPVTEQAHFPELNTAGTYVRLMIKDNGSGIEQSQLKDIFKLFYKFGAPPTETATGAGLAQVKKIVSLHKGAIRLTSEPGNGSIFIVILPIHQHMQAPDQVGAGLMAEREI